MYIVAVVIGLQALIAQASSQTAADPVSAVVQELRTGNYGEAAGLAEAALKRTPNDPRLWTLDGIALTSLDPAHPQRALASLEKAVEIAPTYLPALAAVTQAEYNLGDDRARSHLEQLLVSRPDDNTSNAMLGALDFRSGDYSSAAKHFALGGLAVQDQPASLAEYAISLSNIGQLDAALPLFQKLVQLQPANQTVLYNLCLAQYHAGRMDQALQSADRLANVTDPSEDALTLNAEIHEVRGETQMAVDSLRRATALHPKDPAAYLYLAHLSFAHSSVQVGIDMLDAGIRQVPSEPRLYIARGILLSQLGKNELALRDFDKATALDPKLSMTKTALGIAQSQQHQGNEALATFRANAKGHPDDALTQYLLAEALSNSSPAPDTPAGQEELQAVLAAVRLDPTMIAAQDLLSTIYLRQQEYTKAAEHSEAALRVNPNDQEALFHLIMTARKGINKEQLPALVKRLAAAKDAAPDPMESPRGYLVEAK